MNDLISRKAAIEAIKEDKIDLTNPNVVAVFKATGDFEKVETQVMTCDRHIEILKDLPSAQLKSYRSYREGYQAGFNEGYQAGFKDAQLEQPWIPCSERLPEDEQPILFSTTTGRVHQGRFHRDNSVNRWYSSLDKMRAYNNVVNAWMPLPEPYKEK